jgi:hypothetical protein
LAGVFCRAKIAVSTVAHIAACRTIMSSLPVLFTA